MARRVFTDSSGNDMIEVFEIGTFGFCFLETPGGVGFRKGYVVDHSYPTQGDAPVVGWFGDYACTFPNLFSAIAWANRQAIIDQNWESE